MHAHAFFLTITASGTTVMDSPQTPDTPAPSSTTGALSAPSSTSTAAIARAPVLDTEAACDGTMSVA